jgi:hypothetical protein
MDLMVSILCGAARGLILAGLARLITGWQE